MYPKRVCEIIKINRLMIKENVTKEETSREISYQVNLWNG